MALRSHGAHPEHDDRREGGQGEGLRLAGVKGHIGRGASGVPQKERDQDDALEVEPGVGEESHALTVAVAQGVVARLQLPLRLAAVDVDLRVSVWSLSWCRSHVDDPTSLVGEASASTTPSALGVEFVESSGALESVQGLAEGSD